MYVEQPKTSQRREGLDMELVYHKHPASIPGVPKPWLVPLPEVIDQKFRGSGQGLERADT